MNHIQQPGENLTKASSQTGGGWSGGPPQHDKPKERTFAFIVLIVVVTAVGAAVFATLKYL